MRQSVNAQIQVKSKFLHAMRLHIGHALQTASDHGLDPCTLTCQPFCQLQADSPHPARKADKWTCHLVGHFEHIKVPGRTLMHLQTHLRCWCYRIQQNFAAAGPSEVFRWTMLCNMAALPLWVCFRCNCSHAGDTIRAVPELVRAPAEPGEGYFRSLAYKAQSVLLAVSTVISLRA
jgi:hypothetical protein